MCWLNVNPGFTIYKLWHRVPSVTSWRLWVFFKFVFYFLYSKMGYLSLGTLSSRTWAKDWNVNTLCDSWSQKTPVREWGYHKRMGKKSAKKSLSSKHHCRQRGHNSAGGTGRPCRRCVQSSLTEGWGTRTLVHHQRGAFVPRCLWPGGRPTSKLWWLDKTLRQRNADTWQLKIAKPPTPREGLGTMGGTPT